MKVSNKILSIINHDTYIDIDTDAAKYRIVLLNEDIVRIRCTFEEDFQEEATYSLILTAWKDKMDDLLKEERTRVEGLSTRYEETDGCILLHTANLNISIYKEPFVIEITDKAGNILHSDLKEKSYIEDKQGRLYHYSCMEEEDYYYGFGEKSGYLDKKKRRMRMCNQDTIGYDSKYTDPLYKHIPFYIKYNRKNRIACGMFYHNSYNSIFDMGCERSGYWNQYSYYCTEGGELDIFFINGPRIKDVIKTYTDLTGKTVLPPKYSLGYMGSTMFYTELEKDSDQAILNFIDGCKEEGVPCDGFFLSSGYTTGADGKRYVFNWNYDRFEDPKTFVEEMKNKGVSLSLNVKPALLLSHPLYKEFEEAGAFIKDERQEKPQIDRFWGGQASFVDFTNPKARELWKKYLRESIISLGITSIWNDNNEYEMNELDAVCHFEGSKREVGAIRPVLSNLMALTAREAIAEADPDTRPYVTNRAGFAGIQRYAQTWAGDNSTNWKSLKFNIPVILGMGLSGVANQGCDIGGFYGPAPEPELFVRWVQNGIFQPRFSIHSCNNDNTVTSPLMYPSYTKYIRDAIRLRYKLVPYLYSLLYEASVLGSPVMRPLVYEFETDESVLEESFDFMLGSSLLIANVLERGAKTRSVYLPKGVSWFDWYTKQEYQGGQEITVEVELGSIPMFLRSGAIIPMCEDKMNLHNEQIETMRLLIEPSVETDFILYEDDGTTNHYKNGEFLKTRISIKKGNTVKILFEKEGNYTNQGNYINQAKEIGIDLIGKDIAPAQVSIKDHKLPMFLEKKAWEDSKEGWYYDIEQKTARIKYTNRNESYEVTVAFNVRDLISI